MRFTDNASIESSAMMTDDILAGTDVSEGTDKKFTLANLGAWFLENFNGTIGGKSQSVLNAIESKADAVGVSEELTAGTAGQLLSESYEENFEPYKFRRSPYTDRLSESIVGASVAWNQLVNTSDTSVTVPSGHKYLSRISGTDALGESTGTAISVAGTDNVHDLTQMFGTTVADALYNMGDDGVKLFRSWYPNDYYPYTTPTLEHVYGLQSHDMTVGDKTYSYALDASLTLRGILKYDSSKGIYADGDTYAPDGTVTRRYGITAVTGDSNISAGASGMPFKIFISGKKSTAAFASEPNGICDKLTGVKQSSTWGAPFTFSFLMNQDYMYFKLSDSITTIEDAKTYLASNPITLVYELATPTTESATPYDAIQITDGTEEYVSDCLAPVGHESKYYENLRSKIEGLPTDFSAIICATEATNKASRNYAVGDYLIYNNTLYKVTTAIAENASLTVGTNITATTIMAEIKALQ